MWSRWLGIILVVVVVLTVFVVWFGLPTSPTSTPTPTPTPPLADCPTTRVQQPRAPTSSATRGLGSIHRLESHSAARHFPPNLPQQRLLPCAGTPAPSPAPVSTRRWSSSRAPAREQGSILPLPLAGRPQLPSMEPTETQTLPIHHNKPSLLLHPNWGPSSNRESPPSPNPSLSSLLPHHPRPSPMAPLPLQLG